MTDCDTYTAAVVVDELLRGRQLHRLLQQRLVQQHGEGEYEKTGGSLTGRPVSRGILTGQSHRAVSRSRLTGQSHGAVS